MPVDQINLLAEIGQGTLCLKKTFAQHIPLSVQMGLERIRMMRAFYLFYSLYWLFPCDLRRNTLPVIYVRGE